MLDLDQVRTFVAIAESGSFTKAAQTVHKTQSAVSMQMRRLEEKLGRAIFVREGRNCKLTEDGERFLAYGRRLVQLNDETLAAFDETEVSGFVRLGTPDDYADRFLPEILARFSRSHPHAEVSVVCAPTPNLADLVEQDELDVAIITHVKKRGRRDVEIIRNEPLLWVASQGHSVETETPLPLALGRPNCDWRQAALLALESVGRENYLRYSTWSSTAVGAAVMSGLAISVLPESALRPGMRVLCEADGFPKMPQCSIGIMRNWRQRSRVVEALVEHIQSSLDNLSVPIAAE
ncbi:MAG: LysR family transcriptional regulator [Rhodobacteraceae bacterium]|nr:LysR family transcriptional regulator [Paracoccaceae bacterium]